MQHENELVQIFKLLGHPIRLTIVKLLSDADYMTVGAIVDAVELPQPTVSQQLAKLKAGNIVDAERAGTNVKYSLSNPIVMQIVKDIK